MTEFETLLLIFAKGGTVILEPTVFVNSQQSTIVWSTSGFYQLANSIKEDT